jgi:hypothetical protein
MNDSVLKNELSKQKKKKKKKKKKKQDKTNRRQTTKRARRIRYADLVRQNSPGAARSCSPSSNSTLGFVRIDEDGRGEFERWSCDRRLPRVLHQHLNEKKHEISQNHTNHKIDQ